jgi:hypothetical protein
MRSLVLIISLLVTTAVYAQHSNIHVVHAKIVEHDTIAIVNLNEINIRSFHPAENKRENKRLTRLIRNVKKAYPYAKLAGIMLREYEGVLAEAKNDKERKKIIKEAEKDLTQAYGDDLRDLTFTQGKILIKLIDRETGDTSFDLVRELRGSFRDFFYQTFARIFGYNLKTRYDPKGEDRMIEYIVQMIETGQI